LEEDIKLFDRFSWSSEGNDYPDWINESNNPFHATKENQYGYIQRMFMPIGIVITIVRKMLINIGGAINSLKAIVGDTSSGLVSDINALKATVNNATTGLVKKVDDLETTVGTRPNDLDDSTYDMWNYIKYLEDAFIIKKAPRYDIKGKKFLKTNDKYYLVDHGLMYGLLGKRADKVQVILENIVFGELVRRGYDVYVGKLDDKEIDFVACKNDGYEKLYIQVCLDFTNPETYKREFSPLKAIRDSHPKYVVTTSKWWEVNDEGVRGIHLKDFLLTDL
jgi:hypothetical protein